ncbi:MAG: hypothetical protein K9J21_06500 [Bacteroidales bacterium]|nr:hypothetical protein [Bacteroidales bacterium]
MIKRFKYIGYKVINARICALSKSNPFKGYDNWIMFHYQPGTAIHYYKNEPPSNVDVSTPNFIKLKDHWYFYSKDIENEKQKKKLQNILKKQQRSHTHCQ